MRKIAILGSTGSIGAQTLEIVRNNKDIEVLALCAGHNIDLLEKQIYEFRPKIAAVWDADKARVLAERLKKKSSKTKGQKTEKPVKTEILSGMDGLLSVATCRGTDTLVTGIVGMIGIKPTIAAIQSGKNIALANKETLVTAGHIIMPLAAEKHVKILPVDSEHSAIFQALNGENPSRIDKILLTASGGPFRGKTLQDLRAVTPEQALNHPNWNMGPKVTIDSSTLVNKGLEVMEAKWLFGVGLDQIQVIVQPRSVIHSMVQFIDGSVIAQLGAPDMKLPIQYALFYPDRRPLGGERLDFAKLGSITFENPDMETFRGLKLALEAAKVGGSMPTVFNAANERAVALFLTHRIGYLDIVRTIETCMERHHVVQNPSVEDILNIESATYKMIEKGLW